MFPQNTAATLQQPHSHNELGAKPLPTTTLSQVPSALPSLTTVQSIASPQLVLQKSFNNKQFIADTVSAAIAGFAVSPIVTAVDQAIAESAAGTVTILSSFKRSMHAILTRPLNFINNGAFKWVFLIYFATYTTANFTKTISANHNISTTSTAFNVWCSTSVVNTAACINKDVQFAKLFGGAVRPVPATSLSIWAVRDCLSMFAFFTLPPLIAEIVKEKTGNEQLSKYSAQFFVPLVFQYVLTPIHRLGYDKYNNPGNDFSKIMEFLKKDMFLSAHLRMVRCFPPWVLGVTANSELRARLGAALQTTAHV